MSERKTITIKLDPGEIPETLPELRAWLDDKLSKVPPEFHGNTEFSIYCCSDGEKEVTLRWWRPETDEEFARRQEAENSRLRAAAEQQERVERQMLARLKAKYEPNS